MADVNMVLIGDTYISRPDPDSAFAPVLHLFQDADIRFCNLETIVADAKYINTYDRIDLPRTDEWMLKAYVRAGINVVNQANNPNTFHGYEPLIRSFEVIDAAGIIRAGAGRNLAEARKPAIIERNDTRNGFARRRLLPSSYFLRSS
jgi:poly-gamma-glutamate capsule biosynthesis protein CapA/YwtB (metallophosphatase superfamily)